jgi:hypothetical protein
MDTTPHDIVLTMHRKAVTLPFRISTPPIDGMPICFSGIRMPWRAPISRLFLGIRNCEEQALEYCELSPEVVSRLDKDDALSGEIPYSPFYYIVTKYRSGICRPQRLRAGANGVLYYALADQGALRMYHCPHNNDRSIWYKSQPAFATKTAASAQAIADMEKAIKFNDETAQEYLAKSGVLRLHLEHPDARSAKVTK